LLFLTTLPEFLQDVALEASITATFGGGFLALAVLAHIHILIPIFVAAVIVIALAVYFFRKHRQMAYVNVSNSDEHDVLDDMVNMEEKENIRRYKIDGKGIIRFYVPTEDCLCDHHSYLLCCFIGLRLSVKAKQNSVDDKGLTYARTFGIKVFPNESGEGGSNVLEEFPALYPIVRRAMEPMSGKSQWH
jgi:hypothetical protein